MADVVDKETRSRMMSGIKGKNTKPEMIVRRVLHKAGYRFRLHRKDLPGNPDIVLPRYKTVIFVHGCFWHGHNCHLFRMPASRKSFWREKINGNIERDKINLAVLREAGWRIGQIWECALKGKHSLGIDRVSKLLYDWLRSEDTMLQIRGSTE